MSRFGLSREEKTAVVQQAQERYCDGSDDDIELDDVDKYINDEPLISRFSVADNGTWVQAWLWVPLKEDDDGSKI